MDSQPPEEPSGCGAPLPRCWIEMIVAMSGVMAFIERLVPALDDVSLGNGSRHAAVAEAKGHAEACLDYWEDLMKKVEVIEVEGRYTLKLK